MKKIEKISMKFIEILSEMAMTIAIVFMATWLEPIILDIMFDDEIGRNILGFLIIFLFAFGMGTKLLIENQKDKK